MMAICFWDRGVVGAIERAALCQSIGPPIAGERALAVKIDQSSPTYSRILNQSHGICSPVGGDCTRWQSVCLAASRSGDLELYLPNQACTLWIAGINIPTKPFWPTTARVSWNCRHLLAVAIKSRATLLTHSSQPMPAIRAQVLPAKGCRVQGVSKNANLAIAGQQKKTSFGIAWLGKSQDPLIGSILARPFCFHRCYRMVLPFWPRTCSARSPPHLQLPGCGPNLMEVNVHAPTLLDVYDLTFKRLRQTIKQASAN